MRGRLGGIIGVASQPFSGSASRIWSLAEVYSAKRGAYYTDLYGNAGPWPSNTLTINLPIVNWSAVDWVDATETGEATLSPTVSTPSPGQEFSYFWERSTDDGGTWATVSGSSGAATTDYDYNSYSGGGVATVSLTITGQTVTNDEDRYRLVVSSGLKTFVGPTITVRFEPGFVSPISVQWDGGLRTTGPYTNSLTVSAGSEFSFEMQGIYQRTKYSGDPISPSSLQIQSSDDGGTTWQNQTPDSSQPSFARKYYTASSGDNGRKWRGVATFSGQEYYSPVATLTVT